MALRVPETECDISPSQFDHDLRSTASESVVEVSNFPVGRLILRVLQDTVDSSLTVPGPELRIRGVKW